MPYTMRVAIDMDLRVGAWYHVSPIQVRLMCNAFGFLMCSVGIGSLLVDMAEGHVGAV